MTLSTARCFLCLALITASPFVTAHAQSCSTNSCFVDVAGSMSLHPAAQLSLDESSTTLTAPTAASFANGFMTRDGPTVTVRANTAVRVVVSGGSATWTRNSGASAKAVGDLLWATTVGGVYTPLTTTQSTTNLLSTAATTGLSQKIFYKMLLKWSTDVPGTYALPVVFTLVSP